MTMTEADGGIAASTAWPGFEVTGPHGDQIPLRQFDPAHFRLGRCTITYRGDTGLEKYERRGDLDPDLHARIRTIDETLLPDTDLASVPGPLRWFTNTYGPHTPAALIHDYLIPNEGEEPIVAEEYADRYFRYMLASVGVPRFKRYIMWAAVAMRTRAKSPYRRRRIMLVAWALAAVLGVVTFFAAAGALVFGDGDLLGLNAATVLVIALIAPLFISALWGRQYGAGIVTALAGPWIVPAAIATTAGYGVYLLLEWVGDVFERLVDTRTPRGRPAP